MKEVKGFSLIELLIVIVIIAILAAIGLLAYNGYIKGAKTAAIQSNHGQMCSLITAEVTKCLLGSSTAMDGNLDCSKKNNTDYEIDVRKAALKTNLKKIKNPITSNVGGRESGHEALKHGPYALIHSGTYGASPIDTDSYGYNIISEHPCGAKENCVVFISSCHTLKWERNGQTQWNCGGNFTNGGNYNTYLGKHSENYISCNIPLR